MRQLEVLINEALDTDEESWERLQSTETGRQIIHAWYKDESPPVLTKKQVGRIFNLLAEGRSTIFETDDGERTPYGRRRCRPGGGFVSGTNRKRA